jgi:hypothetical protein
MSNGRSNIGPPIGAVGAVILLASLFLDWYQPGLSAFESFEALDLVLAGLALGCLVGLAPSLGIPAPGGDELGGAVPVLAGAALLIVASQALNHPPTAAGHAADRGLWLGLGGAAILAAGALFDTAGFSLGMPASRPARPQAPRAPARPGPPLQSPPAEARKAEPEVMDELYPEGVRAGPIGTNDPETGARGGNP